MVLMQDNVIYNEASQGFILSSILFLLHINDFPDDIYDIAHSANACTALYFRFLSVA